MVAFFPRPGPGRRGLVDSEEGETLGVLYSAKGIKLGRLGRSENALGIAAFFPRQGMRGSRGMFDATGQSDFWTWGGMLPNGVESVGSNGNVGVLLFENVLGGDETPEGLALSKKGASPLGGLGAPTCSQAQPHPENEMSNELPVADLSNF